MKVSKKNWASTTFGEVAIQQKTDIDRNSDAVDRYVAGEHMNSEDLHIRQWGIFNGQYLGPAFRRKFEKGDILYGSRRTYLKKVAVADFAGITANTTFVIKSEKAKIDPGLLPFLMLSDAFTEHSIKHSKGSVNPYINWKDIANYEFKLPSSLGDQKRIADLLWSIDGVVEKKSAVAHAIGKLYISFLEQTYTHVSQGMRRKIKDLCNINLKNLSERTDPNYRFKYLDIASIVAPNTIGELKEYCFCDAPSRARRVASKHSLVLSLVRPYFQAFVIIENEIKDLIASTGTAVLDVKEGLDYKYLFHVFFTKRFNRYCVQKMTGTNYPAITASDLGNFEMHVPSFDEQHDVGEKLSFLKKVEKEIFSEIEQLKKIKADLINLIFT